MKQIFPLFIIFVALVVGQSAWGAVSVQATLSPPQATLEDELMLTVTLQGSQSGSEPVLPSMPAFKVVATNVSSSIQIINGKIDSKKEYTYVLIPQNEGTFTIDSIAIFVDGQEYRSQPLTVEILKSPIPSQPHPGQASPLGDPQKAPTLSPDHEGQEARDYWIEAMVSNERPYLNEQILYTFRFYTRINVGTANLTLPDFSHFWSEEVVPEKKYYREIGGDRFVISEKVVALYPLQTGDLEIPEALLKIEVPERGRDPFFNDPFSVLGSLRTKSKNLRASSITVQVKPLPEPSPENFTNLVGQFRLSSSLEPSSIKAGESVTWTLELSGQGNIKDAVIPLDSDWSEFKVYDDKPAVDTLRTEKGIQGKKTFKKALVPIRSGSFEIPQMTLAYFNPQTDSYETMTSPVFGLEVTPGGEENLNQVTGKSEKEKQFLTLIPEDIATIHEGALSSAKNEDLKKWIVIALLPPLMFMGTYWIGRKRELRNKNQLHYRSLYALKNFKKSLFSIRNLKQDKRFYEKLLDFVRDYVGNRCGIEGKSLTSEETIQKLKLAGVATPLMMKLKSLMISLEKTCYGGATEDSQTQDFLDESLKLIQAIDKQIKEI